MIVLFTDFGEKDGYVGIMKGVIKGISPQSEIVDLTHYIPPQDLNAAKFVLWNSYKYFPAGTIFTCVVDPGVGSRREIIIVQTEKYVFIAPDNGLLDYVLAELPVKLIMTLENQRLKRDHISQTFHGRDIFAPAAAHLDSGFLITQAGPIRSYKIPISPFIEPMGGETEVHGDIIYIDHFGNLISNLKFSQAPNGSILIDGKQIPVVSSYSGVKPGELLGLWGSHGLLEIAQRDGNAARALEERAFKLVL